MPDSVTIVTDSTAMVEPAVASRRGIRVVPLQVVIGARSYDEGVHDEATPDTIAAALREWTPVSTSRPTPSAFAETYAAAAEAGATGIVSVHLSGEMSGTCESARLAARTAPVPVRVVDTRQLGYATGFAVLTGADVLDLGGTLDEVEQAVLRRAASTTSLFYVDTLEYLRRGGRIGAAAALLGSALSVKPLLGLVEGRIAMREKVRTSSRALARLEELAVDAAGSSGVDVAVAHLAAPQRAAELVDRLNARLGPQMDGREIALGEVGAVIGAHVGPGMVAVVVSPH